MQRYSMFLGWKNQHCEKDYATYAIYRFNVILVRLLNTFSRKLEQNISQFIWKYERFWIAKAILRKKNGAGGVNFPDFSQCYKATVIMTIWYWHKNRNIDQWSKIKSQEINPYTYGYLIFTKESWIHNGAKTASSIRGSGKLDSYM